MGWATRARGAAVALFPSDQVESFKRLIRFGLHDFANARRCAAQALVVKFHGRPKMHVLFSFGYVFFKYRTRYWLHGHWRLPIDVRRLRVEWFRK